VYRHQHDKLGSVYAYKGELDSWFNTRQADVAEPLAEAGAKDRKVKLVVLPFGKIGRASCRERWKISGAGRARNKAKRAERERDGCFFFFQAEDGIRDWSVTGVQTCALPISFIATSMTSWVPFTPIKASWIHGSTHGRRTWRSRWPRPARKTGR